MWLVLIDEWQLVPSVLGAVERAVDMGALTMREIIGGELHRPPFLLRIASDGPATSRADRGHARPAPAAAGSVGVLHRS